MRILYLVTNFDLTGGKERYDRNMIRVLREAGENLFIVKLKNSSLFQKIFFVLRSLFAALFYRPTFVFCAHISFSPVALFLSKVLKIPYVIFTHGIEVWNLDNDIYKKSLKRARCVVVVSRYTEEKLISQIPELRGKIFLLRNTVSSSDFLIKEKPTYLLDKHNLHGSKIILTVARLYSSKDERKGYVQVIDALSQVRKEIPNVRYIVVGAGLKGFGDDRERILVYAEEKEVRDILILPGRVSDKELADYYNVCDVFVMPSTREGFGIVFLEALASGKPVIAGNVDGSGEAILGGELGILVDPENREVIAKAIISVLRGEADNRLYDREYLRKRVLETYGYQVFKNNVTQFLSAIKI